MTRYDRFWVRAYPWFTACSSALWGISGGNDWKLGRHWWAAADWALWAMFAWLTWRACGPRLQPCELAAVDAHVARATKDPMSRSSTTFNTSCPCPHCQGAMEELRVEGERRMVRLIYLSRDDRKARNIHRAFIAELLKEMDQMDAAEERKL